MRGLFATFGQIYGYYLFLKADLRGCKTLLPSKTHFNKKTFNQHISISIREEKVCFIGDVENFLDNLKPWEKKIIEFYYTRSYATFEWIARWFSRHRGSNHPRELHHKSKIHKHFNRIKNLGEGYFLGKGYIKKERFYYGPPK